jgi:hypothetical protein
MFKRDPGRFGKQAAFTLQDYFVGSRRFSASIVDNLVDNSYTFVLTQRASLNARAGSSGSALLVVLLNFGGGFRCR